MAVVKNLMIRIGADYSAARQGMQGATRELTNFKRNTSRTVSEIRGRRGLGGIGDELKSLGSTVTESLSQISSARGVEGVTRSLGAMTPVLGSAVAGLRGLAVAAGGAGSALGPLGIGLGALVGVLALVTAGIAKASQPAVKFEADLGRLNMQLKGSTREFMDWARAQGLAKTTSVEMGATYATLLSSFISNNRELANQTKNLVQTTRVVASATGRTIDDVTERIRSGLLGNTEAIEDLGVFVNVSMIESTKAFQKFANGKHWDQLDFRTQQQIRLQAILEQAYARYGGELQNTVMTKQTLLIEQLKDIKLNLSQAFLPIWDAILPALTKLAEGVAYVTEQIARFVYWLRGWNYDEQTKGTDKQTEAVDNQSQAYNNLASSAKKARGELAAFDQLNLLGDNNDGLGGGGGSGSGLPGPGGSPSGSGGGGGPSGIPPLPPELTKRYRIEFDPPNPPDAGIGAVATAVVGTVDTMVANVKAKLAQMWSDLQGQTQAGVAAQLAEWGVLVSGLSGTLVPALTGTIVLDWSVMWKNLLEQTNASAPALQTVVATYFNAIQTGIASVAAQIRTDWQSMLNGLYADVVALQPSISTEWAKIKNAVSSVINPLNQVGQVWNATLNGLQNQLATIGPNLEKGWGLVGTAIRNLKNPLAEVTTSWSNSLASMYGTAVEKLSGIIDKIYGVIDAWSNLKEVLTGVAVQLKGSGSDLLDATKSWASDFWNSISSAFSPQMLQKDWETIQKEANKPENKAAFDILSWLAGGGALAGAGKAAQASGWIEKLLQSLKSAGISVPAFASGAIVHGPTLAMVGDNPGARTNPEVIAPLSDLEDIMSGGGNGETVAVLRQILAAIQSGRNVQVTISRDEVGHAAATWIDEEYRRGRNPISSL